MIIYRHHKAFFLASTLFVLTMSCNSPSRSSYDLEAYVTVQPISDSYLAGDTIAINVKFPQQIVNRESNSVVYLLELDIRQTAFTEKVWPDSSILISDAMNYVSFLPSNGRGEYSVLQAGIFSYANGELERLGDGSYEMDYQFTLDSTGYYWFKVGKFIETDEPAENPVVIEGSNGNDRYEITYLYIDVPDSNYPLLCEQDPPIGVCSVPFTEERIEEFRLSGSYIFKVE